MLCVRGEMIWMMVDKRDRYVDGSAGNCESANLVWQAGRTNPFE